MRALALAGLLVAVAAPAWAANDAVAPADYDLAGWTLCYQATDNSDVCMIRNASTEMAARGWASSSLEECDRRQGLNTWRKEWPYQADCTETRAYIKQRWGY